MSIYINKFTVNCYGSVTRILFEDVITGKDGAIQANIVMLTQDAELLAQCIADVLKQHRKTTGTK